MFGDVVLCRFAYTSGTQSVVRPALVLFDGDADGILCRITSAANRGAPDVTIQDWQQAGLLLPSVARLDRLTTAERTTVLQQLGTLSVSDAPNVRVTWNQHMSL